jgi:lysozyme
MLIKHEGMRLKPYTCPAGKITIGCGRNLEDVGISQNEAYILLGYDIERVLQEATREFAWFKSLNMPRQDVILSMIFNMGLPRFKGFQKMIAAVINGRFDHAADEMLDSKWASQVGERAKDLAQIMRSGRYL